MSAVGVADTAFIPQQVPFWFFSFYWSSSVVGFFIIDEIACYNLCIQF
jgi:hypothetical protein